MKPELLNYRLPMVLYNKCSSVQQQHNLQMSISSSCSIQEENTDVAYVSHRECRARVAAPESSQRIRCRLQAAKRYLRNYSLFYLATTISLSELSFLIRAFLW